MKPFFIIALVAMNVHAVDCIRMTFDYLASEYMTENLNMYILPGKLKPDSLHQQQKSLVSTIKYHWTQNRLDSMTITHTCQDDVHKGTMKVNWKIDSTKVGKLMKYDWIFPDKSDNFTVFRGKDSVAIVIDKEQTHSFYIKNDTIHEVNDWLPRHWIITRDPANESKCYRKNRVKNLLDDKSYPERGNNLHFTYEYKKRGNFIVQEIMNHDEMVFVKIPGPCEGGKEHTTIFFKQ